MCRDDSYDEHVSKLHLLREQREALCDTFESVITRRQRIKSDPIVSTPHKSRYRTCPVLELHMYDNGGGLNGSMQDSSRAHTALKTKVESAG
jgi:hypothetical protein